MSFRVQDICACFRVNVASALETPVSVSPNNNESGSKKSGTGPGVPLPLRIASPTGSDPAHEPNPRLQVSFSNHWQSPGSPTIPSPLPIDLVYELWHTYVSDEEESGIVLSLESSVDGDIFGVGKRPVQREIEKDGCIQLVFVKE